MKKDPKDAALVGAGVIAVCCAVPLAIGALAAGSFLAGGVVIGATATGAAAFVAWRRRAGATRPLGEEER